MFTKILSGHSNLTSYSWTSLRRWGLLLCMHIICIPLLRAQLPIQSLQDSMGAERRYIVMNISSENCVYCLMQQKQVQKAKHLQSRLHSEVYYLHWTVERVHSFVFGGEQFTSGARFIDQYGRDDNSFVAFPLWLIFDRQYNVAYRYPGLLSPEKIMEILDIIERQEKRGNS